MAEEIFVRPGREICRITQDGGLSERVLYGSPAPESYITYLMIKGAMTCDPFTVGNATRLQEETYVVVYENKLEYSNPKQCCCMKLDNIGTIYLDRDDFLEMDRAGPCMPLCSINPTCNDKYGEGLVLHGSSCCGENMTCVGLSLRSICICRPSKLIFPVEDADELKLVIQHARKIAMENIEKNFQDKAHEQHQTHTTSTYEKDFDFDDDEQDDENDTGLDKTKKKKPKAKQVKTRLPTIRHTPHWPALEAPPSHHGMSRT